MMSSQLPDTATAAGPSLAHNQQLENISTEARSKSPTHNNNKSTTNLHTLLLLSDSALPLGSFAFSSGLESYYAHQKQQHQKKQQQQQQRRRQNQEQPHLNPALPPLFAAAHLSRFLDLSLLSTAAFALPFVFAAHIFPSDLLAIDDFCDASTTCVVARRASVAQGRALLAVWERSFKGALADEWGTGVGGDGGLDGGGGGGSYSNDGSTITPTSTFKTTTIVPGYGDDSGRCCNLCSCSHRSHSLENEDMDGNLKDANSSKGSPTRHRPAKSEQAAHALSSLQSLLRGPHSADTGDPPVPTPSAHYAPLWGAVSCASSLDAHSAAYVFLFGHARAVVSAGVRSGMLGPYQAQAKLAGAELRRSIEGLVKEMETQVHAEVGGKNDDGDDDEGSRWIDMVEHSAQAVPVMDLWVGRHELLYSRIFNS